MYKLASLTLRDVLLQSTASPMPSVPRSEPSTARPSCTTRIWVRSPRSSPGNLAAAGLKKGDRVVILSENRPEWGIAYFGASAAGYVVVPILTDFNPEQIANIIAHSEAKAVVVSEKIGAQGRRLQGDDHSHRVARFGCCPRRPPPGRARLRPSLRWRRIRSRPSSTPPAPPGNSKGVMLSHKNLVSNVIATRSIIRMHRIDRLLSILPLAHTYECTLGLINGITQGSSQLVPGQAAGRVGAAAGAQEDRPTIMLSVPLIIEKIYRASVLPTLQKMGLYKARVAPARSSTVSPASS